MKSRCADRNTELQLTHEEARRIERKYVLHSWSVQGQYQAPTIVGGEGSTFWDLDGHRYLDFSSQAMCNNLGHQHPKVVEAIKRQAEQLCFIQCAWGSLPRARLAQKLTEVAPPNLTKTFFTNGGAEANENAIKIARYYTGKEKIITRYRSYHGATAGALSASGDPRRWAAEPGIPGIVRALDVYCYRCSFGLEYPSCGLRCAEHIAELIRFEGASRVAAVLVEPIVGSNGILVPPEGYMQRLRQICTDNNVLLICDEVMTGFGRTGKWFACQHWDVQPDMMVLAKGLTGAMIPLGGVMVSEAIADYFEDKPLVAGLTYLGHTLACAAGVAAVEAYQQEGLIERSRVLGERMMVRLSQMQKHHPSIGEVRGKGLFAAVELVRDRKTREPLAPFNGSSPAIGRIVSEARTRGVSFAARWNFFILAPPLVITDAELERGLDLLDELLAYADAEAVS
ncbi:MAG: aminotransferase class III-fold pyridoxal phosphate-dependent enzyme [Anaerolineae bacterium]